MKYKKSVIEVKIRLDPIPGWGNTPMYHVKLIQDYLNNVVPHYDPEVKYIRTEAEEE